jgi:hypothetical protein
MARNRFNLSKPLSLPTSKIVLHCYASHGKGFLGKPSPNVPIRILAINDKRQTRWEVGWMSDQVQTGLQCPALAHTMTEWKCLGWVYADGSLPLGELDAVDPKLAQFDNLGPAHCPQFQGNMSGGGTLVRPSRQGVLPSGL